MFKLFSGSHGVHVLAAWMLLATANVAVAADPAKDIEHGQSIFSARCVLCHGVNADGQGQMSKFLTPKPANLRESQLDDAGRERIIRKGGELVGRSPSMPRWELELNDQEIHDVVKYVASVGPKSAIPAGKATKKK